MGSERVLKWMLNPLVLPQTSGIVKYRTFKLVCGSYADMNSSFV